MNPLLKVVFDTNVYLSAAWHSGGHADYWLQEAGKRYRLYVSPAILDEVEEKLLQRFGFENADATQFLGDIKALATVVHPTRRIEVVSDDPDDNMIIECAVEAQADVIVSADPHLYKLKRYESIPIVHTSTLKYMFPEAPAT